MYRRGRRSSPRSRSCEGGSDAAPGADHRRGAEVNASALLLAVRDLYSRMPETRHLRPWELQQILWSLGYTDELEDEHEIAAAREAALTDHEPHAA
jgi:hypothetical protein